MEQRNKSLKSIGLINDYRDLAFLNVFVENPNDPNNIVIEFMVGSAGFPGHTAYLYSSSGTIDENSKIAKRWHNRKKVKDNWFRASD
jgi:hypothetical protein